MRTSNALAEPETAYPALDEPRYKAEVELADRYQGFTAELLRLSLLGIAVFGFLYKHVLLGSQTLPEGVIDTVKPMARWSILLFGLCALLALVFRYWSAESTRLYIDGLRFSTAGKPKEARLKLKSRNHAVIVCIAAKAGAAASLAAGALLVALVFSRLLS